MFGPKGKKANQLEKITLLVDEYEVIRLIDEQGMDQTEAADQMGVARTTVQRIYTISRQKIADALVNGKILMIEGGEYVFCDDDCDACLAPLRKHRRRHLGGKK
jgi:predicted DNA-binding protein (UPF0251 family)